MPKHLANGTVPTIPAHDQLSEEIFLFPRTPKSLKLFLYASNANKSLVVAITYPNNNYIMQVMKMSERNWITSIRFATKLVKSFSQRTPTSRSTNSINASISRGRAKMYVCLNARTNEVYKKKRRTKIVVCVLTCNENAQTAEPAMEFVGVVNVP